MFAPLSACLHVYHSVCVTVRGRHTTAVRLRITVCVSLCMGVTLQLYVCVSLCVCHCAWASHYSCTSAYHSVCECVCTEGVNYGPLHSPQGVELFKQAVADAIAQGGKIECGGKVMCVCVCAVLRSSLNPIIIFTTLKVI